MSPSRRQTEPTDAATDDIPSRTEQRRQAMATLTFAAQLAELPAARLARIELPDDVRREIETTRRITSHVAHKRQLAYLAKLMRRYDDADFAGAHAELGANRDQQRADTAAMHRLEVLREQLLDGDDSVLQGLMTAHPQLDRQHLRALIRRARSERDASKPPRAYREIFQLLKNLPAPPDNA